MIDSQAEAAARKNPSVVIIGAGMTGMCVAMKLRQAGITDITVLEKAASVGGTWRENTYPGVACDVPAHAYTYSWAYNPDWSGFIAPGDEIQRYFLKVFEDHGLAACTHFNEAVTACHYAGGKWTVTTSTGNTYVADLLYAATGMLHQPRVPDIAGMESFAGSSFHSARWDHAIALEGKRIGIVGTGSSATQLIPELIDTKGTDVTVFQRSAQWLVKMENRPYSEAQRRRFRDRPKLIERTRNLSLKVFEYGTTALVSNKFWIRLVHKLMAWNGKRYLNSSIKDPALRAKLTPDYKFGCKRVVMNATFYDAIQKPNAHLCTEEIDKIEPAGIRTRDGVLHELDVIVYATGFDPQAYMRPMDFRGRDGVSIDDVWQHTTKAYRSMFIPQFPNFFLMLGPNSPIGNYSVIAMSEIQTDYTLQLVADWQRGELDVIEAKQSASDAWNAMLKSKMGNTVWSSGCNSWYLDAAGDPLTWPDTWGAWLAEHQVPQLKDFIQPGETSVEADAARAA